MFSSNKGLGSVHSESPFSRLQLFRSVALVGMVLVSLFIVYASVLVNYRIGVLSIFSLFSVLVIIIFLRYPVFGFYTTFFISVFTFLPGKFLGNTALYTGLIPEFLTYIVLVGVLTNDKYKSEIQKGFWTKALTIWLLVQLGYYFFEFFNPNMFGKLGWFNFIRKQISFFAFFYISYAVLDTRKALNYFLNFWIFIILIEALYACKQQWFGIFDFEYNWVLSDINRMQGFINWGLIRKFGLFPDPSSSGAFYASAGLFILVLAIRSRNPKRKSFLYIAAVINILATTYTGTRTATMMLAMGIAFYCLLTIYEKSSKRLIIASVFIFTFIMVAPIYNNAVINRVRSTFKPSDDPSYLVRDWNRKFVQPYIWSHPIGGGIYTSGLLGTFYNPGHILSNVPPDSGYMQVLMEQGYIGLLLTLAFYFVLLRIGIRLFYRTRDPDLKALNAATVVFLFTLLAGQISQIVFFPQYPGSFFVLSAFAYMSKMNYFDKEEILSTN